MDDLTLNLSGYHIRVLPGPYVADGKPTAAAEAFALQLIDQLQQMRAFAATKFLTLYNDTWREDDAPQLSHDEFRFIRQVRTWLHEWHRFSA
jgi:hypothetical protein